MKYISFETIEGEDTMFRQQMNTHRCDERDVELFNNNLYYERDLIKKFGDGFIKTLQCLDDPSELSFFGNLNSANLQFLRI